MNKELIKTVQLAQSVALKAVHLELIGKLDPHIIDEVLEAAEKTLNKTLGEALEEHTA